MIKEKYSIPTMEDIRRIEWNGYNVISTFSGCGGSSLGYKMAGYKVLWANEFIPAAIDTYKANHLGTIVNTSDIRKLKPEEILDEIGLRVGDLDLFDGSPPCASFSMSGKREKLWGEVKKYSDTEQRVDDLFFEYVRLVRGLRPKVFMAENVAGLDMGKAKDILGRNQQNFFDDQSDTILETLRSSGYKVDYRILNSKYFGVAQSRPRLFIIGVRNDLSLSPSFPFKDLSAPIYTLRDAIEDIKDQEEEIARAMIDSKYEVLKWVKMLKPGESGDLYHPNGSYFSLKRIEWDKPTPTILQSHGRPGFACGAIHPEEDRPLTIPELKRVHSLPEDFILTGDFSKQWERVGRSVPPLLMKALALNIKENILDKIEQTEKTQIDILEETQKSDQPQNLRQFQHAYSHIGSVIEEKKEKPPIVKEETPQIDKTQPGEKWEFDKSVTDCFENMLERSIPQYDVMREAVFNLGSQFVRPHSTIIDVGCSKGTAIDPFINTYHQDNNFILIEPSKPMYEYCKNKYNKYPYKHSVDIQNTGILDAKLSSDTSLILSILTIQFTPIEYRLEILDKIYNTLSFDGAFIFVEKVLGSGNELNKKMVNVYHDHKKKNGYTQEDIDRKKTSLEGVLVPVTASWNQDMLRSTGFKKVDCFWRWMNFTGWIALK